MYSRILIVLLFLGSTPVPSVLAFTPKSPLIIHFQQKLAAVAKKKDPHFSGFSAERGKAFYGKKHYGFKKKPTTRSCQTCHTSDPMNASKHVVTGKRIKPLSPRVNRQRFTKLRKIKKWFRRNCKWTLKRLCTAQEKGDFLEFIYSL